VILTLTIYAAAIAGLAIFVQVRECFVDSTGVEAGLDIEG